MDAGTERERKRKGERKGGRVGQGQGQGQSGSCCVFAWDEIAGCGSNRLR